MAKSKHITEPQELSSLPRYVGYVEICKAFGVSKRTIQDMKRAGQFPREHLLPGRVGGPARFLLSDVIAWDEARRSTQQAQLAAMASADPAKLADDDLADTVDATAREFLRRVEGRDIPADMPVFVSRPMTADEYAASGDDALATIREAFAGLSSHNAVVVMLGLCPQYRREALPHMRDAAAMPPVDDDQQWLALALSLLPSR